jgi:hypothetical protein
MRALFATVDGSLTTGPYREAWRGAHLSRPPHLSHRLPCSAGTLVGRRRDNNVPLAGPNRRRGRPRPRGRRRSGSRGDKDPARPPSPNGSAGSARCATPSAISSRSASLSTPATTFSLRRPATGRSDLRAMGAMNRTALGKEDLQAPHRAAHGEAVLCEQKRHHRRIQHVVAIEPVNDPVADLPAERIHHGGEWRT